jgi:hypothetical protein
METVFSEAFKTVDVSNQIDISVFDLTVDPGVPADKIANTTLLYKDDVPALANVLHPNDHADYDVKNIFTTHGRQVCCYILHYYMTV